MVWAIVHKGSSAGSETTGGRVVFVKQVGFKPRVKENGSHTQYCINYNV